MKRRLAIVVVTAVLLVGCAVLRTSQLAAEPILGQDSLTAPPGATTKSREVADALALFKAREFDGALKLWKEAVKKNADMPPAQVIMAKLFFQADMPKESRNALEQAVVDAPGDPEAYLIMAGSAMHDRDVTKAESLYQKAESLMPAFDKSVKRKELLQPLIYSGLAGVAEARKDWAGAQKVIEKWMKLDPKNVRVMQRFAYALLQQKNVEGALEKLREAAKADAQMLTPEAVLAQFYERSGDRENARKWMAAALTAAPKDANTRLAAAQWAFGAGQLDEARKHAIVASQIDPKLLRATVLLGLIAMFERDYESAELFFQSVLKQWPDDFNTSNNLAIVLIEQKDESKQRRALEYAEANVQKFPKSAHAASTYGLALYRLGRLDDAETALRAAAPIMNSDIDTAYVIASMSVDRGRKAEARQMLENALKSTRPAIFRQKAEELLGQLKK